MRLRTFSLVALVTGLTLLLPDLRGGDDFKSGLEAGRLIGGPFLPYTVNDRLTKNERKEVEKANATKDEKEKLDPRSLTGRFHCQVCEFGLNPVVAIFVVEGPDANEAAVQELLKKVDDAVERHKDSYLRSFAIFLTTAARSSVTEKKFEDKDTAKLVDEAQARDKLLKRLGELAVPFNHVVIGFYPLENLKGYDLAKQPGVTVMVYAKHRVLANYPFAEGKLNSEAIDGVIKGVDALMKKGKKKPPQKT